MDTKFVADLKKGDQVVVNNIFYNPKVKTVERTTKTLVVLDNGTRFKRTNGDASGMGNTFHSSWLAEGTPEAIAEVKDQNRRNQLVNYFAETIWRKLPTSDLEEIAKLVRDKRKVQDNKGESNGV